MKQISGFSLIEVMISISIIAVIGVISVTIFTQTLKTSSQTGVLSKLKQNGEQALNVLDDSIRNADSVVCYGPPDGTIPGSTRKDRMVVRTSDGKYIKFRFVDPVPLPPAAPTSNGYVVRQDNLDPTLLSTFCSVGFTTTSPEIAITNNDLSSGVSISDGQFSKKSGIQNKDTVSVSFNVNETKSPPGDITKTAFISTTIQVR